MTRSSPRLRPPRPHSRGETAAHWIESWCLHPHGPARGQPVQLTAEERETIRRVYDCPAGPMSLPIDGPLAAYVVLLHVVGVESELGGGGFMPDCNVDFFTVWNAATPRLRSFLKRSGDHVVCHDRGTRWPA